MTDLERKRAYIFGGHGSQEPEMGLFLLGVSEGARRIMDEVSGRVGYSIVDLLKDRRSPVFGNRKAGIAPDPEKAGVAIYAVQKATIEAAKEGEVPNPDLVLGHSLGQYPAMDFSGVGDLLNFIVSRGIKMVENQKIFQAQVALIRGLDSNTVSGIITDIKKTFGIQPEDPSIEETVRNTPDLSVAVIPDDPLQKSAFQKEVEDKGGSVEDYNAPASHYSGLTWLQQELMPLIPSLSDPIIPVLFDIRASVLTKAAELRSAIESHVVTRFDWSLGLNRAAEEGARDFVIVGPSRVQALLFNGGAPKRGDIQLHKTDTPANLLDYIIAFGNPKSDIAQALASL